ncbi:MAG: 2-oxo acid dehydrogenase subunit E2 [Gammaproteobacteria bacterium]|nr:2-oxo acid dehydrogenase subunit E2 [Gammaproteobacteria bacterium]
MKVFELPDLGEGLTEAEIVEWHVAIGDEVSVDQNLVSVETAKAIVDIPAPWTGKITRLCAAVGDIAEVGKPLVEFEGEPDSKDAGSVIGGVEVGDEHIEETAAPVSRAASSVKAVPAIRALARRLGVDLNMVKASGEDGVILKADVERAARFLAEAGAAEPLRGTRRAMAANMVLANAEVAAATIMEDADIHAWGADADPSIRLIRAVAAGCAAEPALNAWYDGRAQARRLLKKVDLAVAVDTEEGLFVPVLRDIAGRSAQDLRSALDAIRRDVEARSIPPEEMRGYSITLSNYGTIAGRYAAPVVVPPTVAIVGAGRIRDDVVAVNGAPVVHRVLPISLTFDHRAATGGEAGRFLNAVIRDLQSAE